MSTARFLTAEWRWLVMLNYEIDPGVLDRFVPRGTELDLWQGRAFVSVVGFRFLNTRVAGWTIPFHANFEEVNLRFYVRRYAEGEWRPGVVFIRELVPRMAIAWTARIFYNENYSAVPMQHQIQTAPGGISPRVSYFWVFRGGVNRLALTAEGAAISAVSGSEEEFITEHYWGYARQRDGGTVEYQVEHPHWKVWSAVEASLQGDVGLLYGEAFAPYLQRKPSSAFLADGSEVTVYKGTRLA